MEDKEIKIPHQKLRMVANTFVLTVPKKIVEEHKLRKGKKYSFDIHVKKSDKKDEVWEI